MTDNSEGEVSPQQNVHMENTIGVIKFELNVAGALLHANGHDIPITTEEFLMTKKGDLPSGLQKIASEGGISQDELILAARATVPPEIRVTISSRDNVTGIIRNGQDGLIQWEKQPKDSKSSPYTIDVARFTNGNIGPVYLIDGGIRGIGLELNGTKYAPMPIDDFYSILRQHLSIPNPGMQKLKEIVNAYVENTILKKEAVEYRSSAIFLRNGIIGVDFPRLGSLPSILSSLRDFERSASHPLAYTTVFAWNLLAPLHDALKTHVKRIIQAPSVIEAGKTKGGKTNLGDLFIGKGYALPRDSYLYPYERVATRFTLMTHLGSTNMPALLDDLPPDWIWQNRGNLKSYSQTGHFGDRGRSDQTITEYRGRRSFIGTINDSIRTDDDLASANRFIIFRFTERNRERKNISAWNALLNSLPDGFMYEIFRTMFEGQSIDDVARDVEQFQVPADWINYVIEKLNMLSRWYGIPDWPAYQDEDGDGIDSNAMEVAQAFLGEWERIKKNEGSFFSQTADIEVRTIKYRSPIEGEFTVEPKETRTYIYFTGPAFKTLCARQQLKVPYRNASDFMNNIAPLDDGVKSENGGRAKTKKIGNQAFWCYCISIPQGSEGA